jgi:hypothetical protein
VRNSVISRCGRWAAHSRAGTAGVGTGGLRFQVLSRPRCSKKRRVRPKCGRRKQAKTRDAALYRCVVLTSWRALRGRRRVATEHSGDIDPVSYTRQPGLEPCFELVSRRARWWYRLTAVRQVAVAHELGKRNIQGEAFVDILAHVSAAGCQSHAVSDASAPGEGAGPFHSNCRTGAGGRKAATRPRSPAAARDRRPEVPGVTRPVELLARWRRPPRCGASDP